MPLNFWKEDADDGTNTDAAIQPIANGEPVEETYLNRAPQNLRNRTEVIRERADSMDVIERSDRKFAVIAARDTQVLLDEPSSGEFQVYVNNTGTTVGAYNKDIYIVPMLTPTKPGTSDPHDNIPARFYYDEDTTNGLSVSMLTYDGTLRRVADGSHNIYLRLEKDASVTTTPVVEVLGGTDPTAGPVVLVVKIKSDDTTTLTEIQTAINSSSLSGVLSASVNGTGTTVVTLGGSDAWGPVRAYESDAPSASVGYGAQGGVDDEGFRITDSALSTFFSTYKLKDGDTLFLDLTDARTRQKTGVQTTLTAANLHIISDDERLGVNTLNVADSHGAIPICKVMLLEAGVYGVVFLNGKVFEKDVPDYLMTSSYAAAKSSTNFSLSAGTVDSQLDDVLTEMEAHVDGTGTHNISDIDGAPFVVVDPTATYGDYQTISAAVAANRTTGATILIRPGTYAESIRSSQLGGNCTGDFKFIGDGYVVITSDGVNPMIDIDTTYTFSGTWTFEGVRFFQTNSGVGMVSVDVNKTTVPPTRNVVFQDCSFIATTIGSVNLIDHNGCEISVLRCKFDATIDEDITVFYLNGYTTSVPASLKVRDSVFYECDQIIDTVSDTDMREVDFSGNLVHYCGNTSTAATPKQLFNVDANVAVLKFNNNYVSTSGVVSYYGATIGTFRGTYGTISGNYFDAAITDLATSPSVTGIGLGIGTPSNIEVSNNVFKDFGNVYKGLFAGSGAFVHNNTFVTNCWDPYGALSGNDFITLSSNVVFSNNYVGSQKDVDGSSHLINCASGTRIVANQFFGPGVYVDGSGNVVSDNVFTNTTGASYFSLHVEGDNNAVTGNTGQYRFLFVEGDKNTVTGNNITYPSTPTASFTALQVTGTYNVVSGNRLTGRGTAGCDAISSSGSFNNITGNSIYEFDGAIVLSAGDSAVTNNHIVLSGSNDAISLGTSATRVVVSGNKIYMGAGVALYIPDSAMYCTISGNNFYLSDASSVGISCAGDNSVYANVSGNLFNTANASAVAINLASTTSAHARYFNINGNTFAGTTGIGIEMNYCDKICLSGNLFASGVTEWGTSVAGLGNDVGLGAFGSVAKNYTDYNMFDGS